MQLKNGKANWINKRGWGDPRPGEKLKNTQTKSAMEAGRKKEGRDPALF